MGGIKNRDAKLKKNKVFTSGAGGSSKGPSTIDKRNQELQCPHCDRIFKQTGRLQDHIKSRHGEIEAENSKEISSPAKTTTMTKPMALTEGERERRTARPSKQEANEGLKDGDQAKDSEKPSSSSSLAQKTWRIMDMGSHSGAYDFKSPKLILHELLMRNKQPKARYKTVLGSSDNHSRRWRCKVVLPHPKNSEKDIVLFLNEADAAASEDEAQQRAAVVALQRIAGDRSMDRVLPPPYVPLWHGLAKAEEEKRAKKARQEARAAKEASAALKRRTHATIVMTEDKRKYLENVIAESKMHGREEDEHAQGEASGGSEAGPSGWEHLGWPETAGDRTTGSASQKDTSSSMIVDELISLGFEASDARTAVSALRHRSSSDASALSEALDWLCLHVSEDRLPSKFAPGAAGKPVEILHAPSIATDAFVWDQKSTIVEKLFEKSRLDWEMDQMSAASHHLRCIDRVRHEKSTQEENRMSCVEAIDAGKKLEEEHIDLAVKDLMRYGYPQWLSEQTLRESGGHMFDALRQLFLRVFVATTDVRLEATDREKDSVHASIEDWLEEREALKAIFDDDVVIHSDRWITITRRVVLDDKPASIAAAFCGKPKEHFSIDGAKVELDAWIDANDGSESGDASRLYPNAIPLFALRSEDIPPQALLATTQSLLVAADSLRGCPMMYDLSSALHDALSAALTSHLPASLCSVIASPTNSKGDAKQAMPSTSRLPSITDGRSLSNRETKAAGRVDTSSTKRSQRASSAATIALESKRLLEWQQQLEKDPKHASMRRSRARLPAASKRLEVVRATSNHPVVVVNGATGCGKSTQVPQFILEDTIAKGEGGYCNIICTQPRRISAVGLAMRVAAERGESVGGSVGYSVRLDSKQSVRTRLLFCTTGVLLRKLQGNPSLQGITHVILDEVHERSVESDLLLMLLRDVLRTRSNLHLKVILMSATADADLFSSYFASSLGSSAVTTQTIPGFTHPVRDLFLEDVLEATGFRVGKTSKWALKKKKSISNLQGRLAELDHTSSTQASNAGGDLQQNEEEEEELGRRSTGLEHCYSEQTRESLENIDESLVNHQLIEALVCHIASLSPSSSTATTDADAAQKKKADGSSLSSSANAMLIFAPGAEEINRIVRTLEGSERLKSLSPSGLRVLPLHGGLPPSHQARVFDRPPPGVLKVVVATNVAETSITIDDVVVVIDTGRVKEMRFETTCSMARLKEGWVSRASATQRRGRAGRVRPGTCWKLYSKGTWEKHMEENTAPEVLRVPLQGLVMDLKGILGEGAAAVQEVLERMISPPESDAVTQAVRSLGKIGALDLRNGALTPLGRHLVRMPCDPRLGKMLIYGALLRCMDPILTIASSLSHGRSVFWTPQDRRQDFEVARKSLMGPSISSKSDHLAIVSAYNGWRAALGRGGRREASLFCEKYFLSEQSMDAIHIGRRQYADILSDLGFLHTAYPSIACSASYSPSHRSPPSIASSSSSPSLSSLSNSSTGENQGSKWSTPGGPDEYSGHARLVKSALAAGLYPQVLRVDHPTATFTKVSGGAVEIEGEAHRVKFFDKDRGRVFLHPSSVNFSCGKFESGWLVYSELVQTSKVFVRETTMVPVYALILFGGELSVHHQAGLLRVDGWATFKAPGRIAVLVRELRAAAANLLDAKVADPSIDLGRSKVIDAMLHLCSTDGF